MRLFSLVARSLAAGAVAAALFAPAAVTPPCPTEDYDGPASCYWDADVRSNGKGLSFVYDGQTGTVTYMPVLELTF